MSITFLDTLIFPGSYKNIQFLGRLTKYSVIELTMIKIAYVAICIKKLHTIFIITGTSLMNELK